MEVVAIIVGAIGLTGAIVKYLTTMASIQKENQKENQKALAEIHVLVNDRLNEALKRIDQLVEALEASDITVPEKPEQE